MRQLLLKQLFLLSSFLVYTSLFSQRELNNKENFVGGPVKSTTTEIYGTNKKFKDSELEYKSINFYNKEGYEDSSYLYNYEEDKRLATDAERFKIITRYKHTKYNNELWLLESYQEVCACSNKTKGYNYLYEIVKNDTKTEITRRKANDKKDDKVVFHLDSKGNIVKKVERFSYSVFLRDKSGNDTLTTDYDSKNEASSISYNKYDRGNNLIEQRLFYEPAKKSNQEGFRLRFSYEFDKRGNWITMKEVSDEIDADGKVTETEYSLVKRTIIYY
jgi:hypothetical protein